MQKFVIIEVLIMATGDEENDLFTPILSGQKEKDVNPHGVQKEKTVGWKYNSLVIVEAESKKRVWNCVPMEIIHPFDVDKGRHYKIRRKFIPTFSTEEPSEKLHLWKTIDFIVLDMKEYRQFKEDKGDVYQKELSMNPPSERLLSWKRRIDNDNKDRSLYQATDESSGEAHEPTEITGKTRRGPGRPKVDHETVKNDVVPTTKKKPGRKPLSEENPEEHKRLMRDYGNAKNSPLGFTEYARQRGYSTKSKRDYLRLYGRRHAEE